MLIRFFRSEPAAAIVLLISAALALIVANSPLRDAYHHVLTTSIAGLTVHHWINDALMAAFFLMVGLEIKREMVTGSLSSWPDRVLPGIAAFFGMVVPALIFITINLGDRDHLIGWAVPTATDIAFALGILTIMGRRVPAALRIILVSIAIIDDLLAILVIAVFYSDGLVAGWLVVASVCVGGLAILNRRGTMLIAPYVIVGVGLWVALYNAGLHATLAGVLVALFIPTANTNPELAPPVYVLEHRIVYWVNFLIVPLFGFTNAGVSFSGLGAEAFVGTLPLGIMAGLFLGKQIGIFGSIWMMVRLGVANMPARTTWPQIHAMAVICGIGFTMSLFIGELAFAARPEFLDATKIGAIGGSLISASVGIVLMRRSTTAPSEL